MCFAECYVYCVTSSCVSERTVSTAPANMHREEGQASEAEPLVTPEDLVPVELGSWLKKPKTLTQPRSVPDVFATSSSQIGAVVDGTSTACE